MLSLCAFKRELKVGQRMILIQKTRPFQHKCSWFFLLHSTFEACQYKHLVFCILYSVFCKQKQCNTLLSAPDLVLYVESTTVSMIRLSPLKLIAWSVTTQKHIALKIQMSEDDVFDTDLNYKIFQSNVEQCFHVLPHCLLN